jgi:hypothetical protein
MREEEGAVEALRGFAGLRVHRPLPANSVSGLSPNVNPWFATYAGDVQVMTFVVVDITADDYALRYGDAVVKIRSGTAAYDAVGRALEEWKSRPRTPFNRQEFLQNGCRVFFDGVVPVGVKESYGPFGKWVPVYVDGPWTTVRFAALSSTEEVSGRT